MRATCAQQNIKSQIGHYLLMFLQGDTENAFHGLLEIGQEAIPKLIDSYRDERNIEIRELLVEVIWQYRDNSAIPFLGGLCVILNRTYGARLLMDWLP